MRRSGFPKLTILMVRGCLRSGRFLKTKPETGILSQVLGMGKLYEKAVRDFLGISQARILEWVAISFSRGSFRPRDPTHISCTAGGFFIPESTGRRLEICKYCENGDFILPASQAEITYVI